MAHITIKALDEVDVLMRELLDIDKEMLSHEETLKELHQKLMVGERVVREPSTIALHFITAFQEDVMGKYDNAVIDKMNQYRSKTSRQKYGSSEVYTQFKQGIFVRLSQHSCANPELTSPHTGGPKFWCTDTAHQRIHSTRYVSMDFETCSKYGYRGWRRK